MTEDEHLRSMHEAWKRGERLIDLNAVHAWLREYEALWGEQGLTLEIRPPTQGRTKNSLTAEITTPIVIAALTVWDSGEYELGVMNRRTQDEQASPYHPAHTVAVLIADMESELRRLGVVAPASASPWRGTARGVTVIAAPAPRLTQQPVRVMTAARAFPVELRR